MVICVKIFKTEKTVEIHLVRLTEVCCKVLSEKYAYMSVKTALLLSNDIDADHQNSCLFTKAIFHYLQGFILVFELNFMSNTINVGTFFNH